MRRLGVSLAFLALLSLLGVGAAMGRHIQGTAFPATHAHATHACCPADTPTHRRPACPHLPAHLGAPLAAVTATSARPLSALVPPGAATVIAGRDTQPATPPPRPGTIA